jgi:thiol:disulfide interchange protein DsbC
MFKLGLLLLSALLATASAAAPTNPAATDTATPSPDKTVDKTGDPRAAIAAKFPGVKPENVKPSPINGMYEVVIGTDTAYVSADGRYLIGGDMYDVEKRVNLTESNRSASRSKALAKLDERDMIVFAPAAPKYTISVFTDVECGYCQKLHSEIEQLNKLGVRVRYLAYPRAGPGTDDWRKMESVWCSKDRKNAITKAKQGQDIGGSCGATPVGKQYALGEQLGVRGTPAIFTPAGDYIGGYLPPASLVEKLDQLKAAAGPQ